MQTYKTNLHLCFASLDCPWLSAQRWLCPMCPSPSLAFKLGLGLFCRSVKRCFFPCVLLVQIQGKVVLQSPDGQPWSVRLFSGQKGLLSAAFQSTMNQHSLAHGCGSPRSLLLMRNKFLKPFLPSFLEAIIPDDWCGCHTTFTGT